MSQNPKPALPRLDQFDFHHRLAETAGTVLVKDIQPGLYGSDPSGMLACRDRVVFSANDGTNGPDLLVLATDLAGIGRTELPLEVSAIDMFGAVTDPAERSLNIAARTEVSLAQMFMGREQLGDTLDRARAVSEYLLDRAHVWLGDG